MDPLIGAGAAKVMPHRFAGVHVGDAVDLATQHEFNQAVRAGLATTATVVMLDLGKVTFLGSVGMRVSVQANEEAQNAGLAVRVMDGPRSCATSTSPGQEPACLTADRLPSCAGWTFLPCGGPHVRTWFRARFRACGWRRDTPRPPSPHGG